MTEIILSYSIRSPWCIRSPTEAPSCSALTSNPSTSWWKTFRIKKLSQRPVTQAKLANTKLKFKTIIRTMKIGSGEKLEINWIIKTMMTSVMKRQGNCTMNWFMEIWDNWYFQKKPCSLTMSGPVWKVAVNINFDFLSFAIWQNFRKKMNEDVHNFPDDAHSIFSDVQTRLWCTFCNGVGI